VATTRFNTNIIVAAQRLKSPRTDATTTGDVTGARYTSVLLSRYQNRAIREIILKKIEELGERFASVLPEYVATSGAITTPSSGIFTKNADVISFLELVSSSIVFQRVSVDVLKIAMGQDYVYRDGGQFYEEGRQVKLIPATQTTVTGRYVKQHIDIVPTNDPQAGGGGKVGTTANYTAATRILTCADTFVPSKLASTDIGKIIVFCDATKVYSGRIESLDGTHPTYIAVLSGDNLPTGNITSNGVTKVLVVESSIDGQDILLPDLWDGRIVDLMVQYGLADAKANAQEVAA
jgi:hypothetical protein